MYIVSILCVCIVCVVCVCVCIIDVLARRINTLQCCQSAICANMYDMHIFCTYIYTPTGTCTLCIYYVVHVCLYCVCCVRMCVYNRCVS